MLHRFSLELGRSRNESLSESTAVPERSGLVQKTPSECTATLFESQIGVWRQLASVTLAPPGVRADRLGRNKSEERRKNVVKNVVGLGVGRNVRLHFETRILVLQRKNFYAASLVPRRAPNKK